MRYCSTRTRANTTAPAATSANAPSPTELGARRARPTPTGAIRSRPTPTGWSIATATRSTASATGHATPRSSSSTPMAASARCGLPSQCASCTASTSCRPSSASPSSPSAASTRRRAPRASSAAAAASSSTRRARRAPRCSRRPLAPDARLGPRDGRSPLAREATRRAALPPRHQLGHAGVAAAAAPLRGARPRVRVRVLVAVRRIRQARGLGPARAGGIRSALCAAAAGRALPAVAAPPPLARRARSDRGARRRPVALAAYARLGGARPRVCVLRPLLARLARRLRLAARCRAAPLGARWQPAPRRARRNGRRKSSADAADADAFTVSPLPSARLPRPAADAPAPPATPAQLGAAALSPSAAPAAVGSPEAAPEPAEEPPSSAPGSMRGSCNASCHGGNSCNGLGSPRAPPSQARARAAEIAADWGGAQPREFQMQQMDASALRQRLMQCRRRAVLVGVVGALRPPPRLARPPSALPLREGHLPLAVLARHW